MIGHDLINQRFTVCKMFLTNCDVKLEMLYTSTRTHMQFQKYIEGV